MKLDCVQQRELRDNIRPQRDVVRIGCGAGFAGDRPNAALRLLQQVPDMHYLVLECLAERTLSTRYEAMVAGGKGYDPRISEWIRLLLPEALSRGVRLITNMGAVDPLGAQEEVMELAAELGLSITVAVAYELLDVDTVRSQQPDSKHEVGGYSTYLGAAPLVHALDSSRPDVLITSRVADASLFLAPMIYELGWKWQDWQCLAQGTLAGHLLECGCQLTGGYFMHPADPRRSSSVVKLLAASLPYADVTWDGGVTLGKIKNSGGELSVATCTQQLLYEIGDPAGYITPDVIVNFTNVCFEPLSTDRVIAKGAQPAALSAPVELLRLVPKHCGWKGWGEISYGGSSCLERAAAADYLVRAWLEETHPGVTSCILSYHVGQDSLQIFSLDEATLAKPVTNEVRLRMDGLFEMQTHASKFIQEFEALYTNGPAGGGGIRTGLNHEILLHKSLVPREQVQWKTSWRHSPGSTRLSSLSKTQNEAGMSTAMRTSLSSQLPASPAPSSVELPLYKVAHGRTGDKGNQLNVSVIPHCRTDLARLQLIITPAWVIRVLKHLLLGRDDVSRSVRGMESLVEVFAVPGVAALNIVVKDVLDGGVTCSRRLDRHGKSVSDLILSQSGECDRDKRSRSGYDQGPNPSGSQVLVSALASPSSASCNQPKPRVRSFRCKLAIDGRSINPRPAPSDSRNARIDRNRRYRNGNCQTLLALGISAPATLASVFSFTTAVPSFRLQHVRVGTGSPGHGVETDLWIVACSAVGACFGAFSGVVRRFSSRETVNAISLGRTGSKIECINRSVSSLEGNKKNTRRNCYQRPGSLQSEHCAAFLSSPESLRGDT